MQCVTREAHEATYSHNGVLSQYAKAKGEKYK
jgi:hypothetical protein